MKSFLTIRGNLLVINLVVIGLILWLAISFLYIAVAQRRDAKQLQANVDTERIIFNANNALAYERDSFDKHLNTPVKPNAHYYQQLEAAGRESDAMLDKMTEQIMHQISDHQFFEHMPTTPSILQERLDGLERDRDQLRQHRKYSLAQYLLAATVRDRDMPSILFESQTDTIEDLVGLAKSLKYLPDTNASAIAHYHALLNEILVTNVELARKNTALNKILSNNRVAYEDARLQIAVMSQKLEQRFAEIVLLAQASDNITQLLPIATQAQQFYQQDYLRVEGEIHSLAELQDRREFVQTQWRTVMSTLSRLTGELAEATHVSIDVIADNYGARATRNLVIDIFLVFLCFAITLASIAINRRIKQYAYYDSLTKLPNRMNFESTLQNMSASSTQIQAVIFIDLDRFKSINDNYGHSIGDELLKEVALRLNKTCRSAQLVARMGGDEFAVFIADAQSDVAVETMASQIMAEVRNKIVIRGHSLKVGASVGISVSPHDCACGIELLKNADIAMYHCKANKHKGAYRFNQKIANDYQQRLQLELDLKKGLENNEFHLVYQPKICTDSGQVKGVEALLRWLHPVRGFVSPAQFIPVAEETGLMGSIGLWVLNEACREAVL